MERELIKADGETEPRVVIGYMCLIDWQHEIGVASGGSKVYASLDDLKEDHDCWAECGVVEVAVSARQIVEPQNLLASRTRTPA